MSPIPSGRTLAVATLLLAAACGGGTAAEDDSSLKAFVGARLFDGTESIPLDRSVILVEDGRIQAIGTQGDFQIPAGIEQIDLAGRTLIPGLVNTHGHVGDVQGLESGNYSRQNVLDQLSLYARYGVTTVLSLGDDQEEGVQVRSEQMDPSLDRARLFVAGPVLDPSSAEEAVQQVQQIAEMGVDWVKFRIDSGLGAREKMTPETYRALIDAAHDRGIPVAAHIVELEDAKEALRAGVDFIAHSVRDAPVDDELIALLREGRICLTPTLTRELSTFVYGSRPDFFDDPFFLREADPAVVDALQDPARQQRTRESAAAQYWEAQLPQAMDNLRDLTDAGVRIALGTDSGPAGRFQGYFEHLEMEMMAEAGLTPMQILLAATGNAARCVGLDDEVGTIEPGKWADFVVLEENPLEDIRNTRTIDSVWIAGNRVPM
ncbi:MAG: amidohydrolase family protein [Gemmatimonadota bacterium]